MKNSEIKELTTQEIVEKLDAERSALTRFNLNHAISPLENPLQIKETRRNIAKLMTEKRQRQLTEK
ncbi:50S ribosomal protein L29 [Ancylomarina sp. DW003]|uniref:Large ribosomal subunit protein uL29 n=1 Tax=Paralabilibaculum antarcticum TaxID=2912572 RepID=A0ABT5VS90_9BACT|nr:MULTISPECIES: 50S ribosomal protein L29 [Marinifilaceae]MDE5418156.1 50S ribosomal protein L29 [Labilibaculum sp. DW002]MDE5420785.1 50S ribosomal protein L29 [Ancylomarina sp. DW003]